MRLFLAGDKDLHSYSFQHFGRSAVDFVSEPELSKTALDAHRFIIVMMLSFKNSIQWQYASLHC